MVKSRAGHLVVLGAFVAALGVVFVLDALRWLLPMVTPDSAGIGANQVQPDGCHPNPDGMRALGAPLLAFFG